MLKEKVNGYPEEREKKGFRCITKMCIFSVAI
jgi:hypothetical protein